MKAHIDIDDGSRLVQSVIGTTANVEDVTQVDKLLHDEKSYVCANAGYTFVEKRAKHEGRKAIWPVASRRNAYKLPGKRRLLGHVICQYPMAKAQTQVKLEHPLRGMKCKFGYTKGVSVSWRRT